MVWVWLDPPNNPRPRAGVMLISQQDFTHISVSW